MSRVRKVYSLVATDADGIATSQTPSGAGNLTLDGALTSGGALTLSNQQFVTITGGSDESGKTFTIYGTSEIGSSISEDITGPNAETVTSTLCYKTVTRIAVDAATTGAITAGISGSSELPWIPLSQYIVPFQYEVFVDANNAMYEVQSTLDNVQDSSITPVVNANVDIGNGEKSIISAIRLKVKSFVSGDIVFNVLQSGR